MRTYKISEILYWVIAGISTFKTISLWNMNNTRAYYFLGFAILSILSGCYAFNKQPYKTSELKSLKETKVGKIVLKNLTTNFSPDLINLDCLISDGG